MRAAPPAHPRGRTRGFGELGFEVVIGELLRDWARVISLRDRPEPATASEALEAMFRADLDVAAAADVVCQLQSDYANRAYRSDPLDPATPALIDAAIRLIAMGLRP